MNEWIKQITDWFLETTHLGGYSILLLTIPLAVLQGIFGFFPFATIVMLHISLLGIMNGLLASWIAGTAAGMVVYLMCRYFFAGWFNRKWMGKLQKYEKWQKGLDRYGVWAVIFLRTVPIMPNNLISFMSAISNLKLRSYTWSNLVGNLSSIWLFGILSASIVFPGLNLRDLILSYAAFLLILGVAFILRNRAISRKKSDMTP
ncbi:VTT domain-containing protein [Paenibacillus timonensis]|uniref:TVP38/TMEM64 family membrane protein n=1 Tax=Paenibacillus timonensis TaxID=225915 RepID=A0ABW3SGD6_9BACL|nr:MULTISPECIES: VTT domain-containing protein [Paenibacillus]MCH1642540.1 VTT domain-containing protein [Paenibacillus timonensis]MDU2243359.1 VTT domain-containing protein [Paenibacillus sp.]